MIKLDNDSTICALSTPYGASATAVIKISGKNAFHICDRIFVHKKHKRITEQKANTVIYGDIVDSNSKIIDNVIITKFSNPASFTGEDTIEISCHGSLYIIKKIIELLIDQGAVMAQPGEFSLRAFSNGKINLSQAEAIADLIHSSSEIGHKLAVSQMRGEYSTAISELRSKLLHFSSLIELELDFSEEDLQFANRDELKRILFEIVDFTSSLLASFKYGNSIKTGIPVAIIGEPNVGKSTLLNCLAKEEKAIVSDIPGTTRDSIEDLIIIQGIPFRFIDTAGIRNSEDEVEKMGIQKTYAKSSSASIILYMVDVCTITSDTLLKNIDELRANIHDFEKKIIVVANKIDNLIETPKGFSDLTELDIVYISAKRHENLNQLTEMLLSMIDKSIIENNAIVSNIRHYESLSEIKKAVHNCINALENNISSDFIAMDIRQSLHYLGEITGEVTTDEILGNIFKNFCIGK
jgi:tRNA modification GTPase